MDNFHVLTLGDKPQAKKYTPRRKHVKSRGGCLGCKVKRIKCDETKPTCQKCHRSHSTCTYAPPAPGNTMPLARSISALPPPLQDIEPTPYGTPRIALLHHFYHAFHQITFSGTETDPGPDPDPNPDADFASSVVHLALQRPHLLSSLLAVSASHLRHHAVPGARVAECYQQQLALRSFQGALAEGAGSTQGADALLLTAMFLNLLAFTNGEEWVGHVGEGRLGWLRVQLGLKPLLLSTKGYRDGTILEAMFEAGEVEGDLLPDGWRGMFGGDEVWTAPARVLAMIRHLPPRAEMFFLYVSAFGKMDEEFVGGVEKGDVRAMWLFGYWLGLLCRLDFWWLQRVRRDHGEIVRWLEGRVTHEMLEELRVVIQP